VDLAVSGHERADERHHGSDAIAVVVFGDPTGAG
jgi:hypothetical protein